MEKPMLKIIFFARLREFIDIDEVTIELENDGTTTVQDVLTILKNKYDKFDEYIERGNRFLIAVNQDISGTDRRLNSGDELALFPPVTGG